MKRKHDPQLLNEGMHLQALKNKYLSARVNFSKLIIIKYFLRDKNSGS